MQIKTKRLWLRTRAAGVINETSMGKRTGKMGTARLATVHNVLPKGAISLFKRAFEQEAATRDGYIGRDNK